MKLLKEGTDELPKMDLIESLWVSFIKVHFTKSYIITFKGQIKVT